MLFCRMTETISGVSRRLTRAGLVLALLASGVTAALPAGAFLDLPEIEINPSEDGNYALPLSPQEGAQIMDDDDDWSGE